MDLEYLKIIIGVLISLAGIKVYDFHDKLINEWYNTKFTKIKCEFEKLKKDYYDIMRTKNDIEDNNEPISEDSQDKLNEISSVVVTFDELVFEHLNKRD